MRFFITGTAGFIGFHLARRLLDAGHSVTGFDGMTAYYDPNLKRARLEQLLERETYSHVTAMLEDMPRLEAAAKRAEPDVIIHLAAQAGVRYSLENPRAYVDANLVGSFNVLEIARALAPKHLMLASTSSVYGANAKVPFGETDRADEPMTLYAATKKSMELMAHSYAHLWKIPTTVFRFFTVYGPYGRPDMAPLKFIAAIENGLPIEVYGEGRMSRDFTYIDDLVAAIAALVDIVPDESNRVHLPHADDTLSPVGPFRVVNIGGGQPVGLMAFIAAIEMALARQAEKVFLPMQKGDVPQTFASAELLRALTGRVPDTTLAEGVRALVNWYRDYTAIISS